MITIPKEQIQTIATKAQALRLQNNLTQEGLAKRSGVSFGSIKRFETTGQISLESLLKIAFVLNAIDDFSNIFSSTNFQANKTFDEIMSKKKIRKRGSKK